MTTLYELKRIFSQNKFADIINDKLEVADHVSCKTILELIDSHEQLQIDAKKDYEDMRKFQIKFIESDHKRIDLEDKLDKACEALEFIHLNFRKVTKCPDNTCDGCFMDAKIAAEKATKTLLEIRKKDDNG